MHLALPSSARLQAGHIGRLGPIGRGAAMPPSPGGKPGRRLLLGGALALSCLALSAAAAVWRGDVVRLVPQTARLYAAAGMPVNLRGLSLDAVRSVEEIERGEPILVVSGTITNISESSLDVPRLRLAVRGAEATEIYVWTAGVVDAHLAPGQSTGFRARLAAPPEAGRSVAVRFADVPKTRLGLR